MKNNILVTYDLNKSGQNYDALIEEIKQLGAWAKSNSLFGISILPIQPMKF